MTLICTACWDGRSAPTATLQGSRQEKVENDHLRSPSPWGTVRFFIIFVLRKAHCMTPGKWEERSKIQKHVAIWCSCNLWSLFLLSSPIPPPPHFTSWRAHTICYVSSRKLYPNGMFFPAQLWGHWLSRWLNQLRFWDTDAGKIPPGKNEARLDTDYRTCFQRIKCVLTVT